MLPTNFLWGKNEKYLGGTGLEGGEWTCASLEHHPIHPKHNTRKIPTLEDQAV